MMSSCVVQISIREISPNSQDFKLVGVIISKRNARSFVDKKNVSRSVWNFTLRDSMTHYINVAAWGSEEYIDKLFMTFNVGDIVEVINPRVNMRKNEVSKYEPTSTSDCELTMSENSSEMNYYCGPDIEYYNNWYHYPIHNPESYTKLQDIVYFTQHNQERRDIDLLVAVKYVGATRIITTKRGNTTATREIDMMDDTHSGFPLFLWGVEVVGQADKWTPRETVLFISDVTLSYNEYRKCWGLSTSAKSIITPNPDTDSGRALKEFAKAAPLDAKSMMNQLVNTIDASQITNILSCKSITDRCTNLPCADHFTALVYAVIVDYDLDGLSKMVISKCNHCAIVLDDNFAVCTNALCPGMTSGMSLSSNLAAYNIRVSLSDHTGQIKYCLLSEDCATAMTGFKAEQFNTLPIDVRTQIKWKFLLKRVMAKLIVLADLKTRNPVISVVSVTHVCLGEYCSKVPPF